MGTRFSFYSPVSMDKPDLCRMFFAAARSSLFSNCVVADFTRAREAKFSLLPLRCCSNVNEEMEMPLHREKSNKEERVPHIKWTRLCNVLCMRAPSFVPCTDIVLDTSESAASSTGAYLFLSNLSNVQISFFPSSSFYYYHAPPFSLRFSIEFFFSFHSIILLFQV